MSPKRDRTEKRIENAAETLQHVVEAYMAAQGCNYIDALRGVTRDQPILWKRYQEELPASLPNRKEQRVMQAKARGYLLRVVALMDRWGPPGKPFAIGHQSSTVMKAMQRTVVVPDEGYDLLGPVMTKLVGTAKRVLESMAADQSVRIMDLDVLTEVLNQHQDPVRYRPVALEDPRLTYRRKGGLDVSFVEDLLNYMDLAAKYGRQHHRCQRKECGSLMISGRGGKKFCSHYCRVRFWKYSEQKPYYIKRKDISEKRLRERSASVNLDPVVRNKRQPSKRPAQ
jgi:hypothetical protein